MLSAQSYLKKNNLSNLEKEVWRYNYISKRWVIAKARGCLASMAYWYELEAKYCDRKIRELIKGLGDDVMVETVRMGTRIKHRGECTGITVYYNVKRIKY